jgi:hypothetical protein
VLKTLRSQRSKSRTLKLLAREILQLLEERQEDQRMTNAPYQYYEVRFAALFIQQTSAL